MLFTQEHLEGIKSGAISLAFRKWNKLAVKKDSLMKTSIGMVQIMDVQPCELSAITEKDAVKAGYPNLKMLQTALNKNAGTNIYRIHIQYHSPDPRIQLRAQKHLPEEELALLTEKVARLDKYSKQGDWTLAVLTLIRDHPKLRAADLAIKIGKEKDWLKLNIRKLKNLGLTISHEPGYTLSPLGIHFLKKQQGK